jgi:hypothetical protein
MNLKSRMKAIEIKLKPIEREKKIIVFSVVHQTVKVRDYKMNQSVNLRSIQTQIKSRLFTI